MTTLLSRWLRSYPAQAFILATLIVVLSLLPENWKMCLHTRGAMHCWGHLYFFSALATTLMRCSQRSYRYSFAVAATLLFGVGIELIQARGFVSHLEAPDVVFDCIGILVAWVSESLRAPSFKRSLLATGPPLQA